MANPTRPGRYAFHANMIAVSLPTAAEDAGYVKATIADPNVANALGKQHSYFAQYHDLTAMKLEDFVAAGSPALVRGVALTYPTSAGLANLAPTTTPATLGGGCRTTFDTAVLEIYGLSSAKFAPNARTYFYGGAAPSLGEYPTVTIDVVGLLDPPNPGGGQAVLGGVQTDATDVTANLTSGLLGQAVEVDADLTFTGVTIFDNVACKTVAASGDVGTTGKFTGDGASAAVTVDGLADASLKLDNNAVAVATLQIANASGGPALSVTGTAVFDNDVNLNGDVTTIGNLATDDLVINAEVQTDIVGTQTKKVSFGIFEFITAAGLPLLGQIVRDGFNRLIYDDDDPQLVHFSPNGWVYATGDQEAATGFAVSHTVALTSVAVKGNGLGLTRVIVEGQLQVSAVGSTVDIAVQENLTADPAFTDIGALQVLTALKTNIDANDWQSFRHERIFNSGFTDDIFYRAKITANGGPTVKVKEVRLRVVNER